MMKGMTLGEAAIWLLALLMMAAWLTACSAARVERVSADNIRIWVPDRVGGEDPYAGAPDVETAP